MRVYGYVNAPDGLGGTSAEYIEPTWLTDGGLMLYGTTDEVNGEPGDDWYVVAAPARFGDLQQRYWNRWVTIEAHFDDAKARTCHWEGPDPGSLPSDKSAVRLCRSILVLSSIRTSGGPDTAAAAAPASVSTGAAATATPASAGAGRTSVLRAAFLGMAGIVGAIAFWLRCPRRSPRRLTG